VGIDERHSLDSDKRTSTIITNNSNKNKKVVARKGSDQVSLGGLSKQKEDVFVRVAEDPESP
jgi:DeoR/GlpR family transcriptional regulator of sugar metabolism